MLDIAILSSIAKQLTSGTEVEVQGKSVPVRRTSSQRLRMASFTMGGREYTAIEQNPEKPSRWGKLAREEHQVVQFKDVRTNRFVAVAVDGEVKEYGLAAAERNDDKPMVVPPCMPPAPKGSVKLFRIEM